MSRAWSWSASGRARGGWTCRQRPSDTGDRERVSPLLRKNAISFTLAADFIITVQHSVVR